MGAAVGRGRAPTSTSFVINGAGSILAESEVKNPASQAPFEFLDYDNATASTADVRIVIAKYSGQREPAVEVRAARRLRDHGGPVQHLDRRRHRRTVDLRSQRHRDGREHRRDPVQQLERRRVFSSRGPETLYFEPTPSTAPLAAPGGARQARLRRHRRRANQLLPATDRRRLALLRNVGGRAAGRGDRRAPDRQGSVVDPGAGDGHVARHRAGRRDQRDARRGRRRLHRRGRGARRRQRAPRRTAIRAGDRRQRARRPQLVGATHRRRPADQRATRSRPTSRASSQSPQTFHVDRDLGRRDRAHQRDDRTRSP